MERTEHQLADEITAAVAAFVEAVCSRDPEQAEREAAHAFDRAAMLIETVPDFPFRDPKR